jgi:polysaccharide biosynthesis protein VpsM
MKWKLFHSQSNVPGHARMSGFGVATFACWVMVCTFLPTENVVGQEMNVVSQEEEGEEGEEGEGGLQYGISGELRYDDNIYLAESGGVDSTILEAVPFVRATFYNNGNTYQLGYRLNHAEYFDASDDNYDDHDFAVDLNHRFAPRHALAVTGAYRLLSEERGTGFSEEPGPVTDSPDEYVHKELNLKYLLGLPSADLRFELAAGRQIMDFDSSYVGDSRDYLIDQLGILARYRLGARSDLLLEYRTLDVEYDNTPLDFNGQPLDLAANEDYLMVGLGWELTAKTRGEVKLGRSGREYDTENLSTSDFHWEAEVEWRPKTYSRFAFNTARTSQETYGSGLFVNTRTLGVTWTHNWKGYLKTDLGGGLIEDQYEGSVRIDDRMFWQIALAYDATNWLNVGLGYKYQENDSTFHLVNYEQNVLYLKLAVDL